jgi:hypothetical protein
VKSKEEKALRKRLKKKYETQEVDLKRREEAAAMREIVLAEKEKSLEEKALEEGKEKAQSVSVDMSRKDVREESKLVKSSSGGVVRIEDKKKLSNPLATSSHAGRPLSIKHIFTDMEKRKSKKLDPMLSLAPALESSEVALSDMHGQSQHSEQAASQQSIEHSLEQTTSGLV